MDESSSGLPVRVDDVGVPEYRITGRGGVVVVTLRLTEGLLAEPGGLLYRRGGVGWSLASTGRNLLGRIVNQASRRARARCTATRARASSPSRPPRPAA